MQLSLPKEKNYYCIIPAREEYYSTGRGETPPQTLAEGFYPSTAPCFIWDTFPRPDGMSVGLCMLQSWEMAITRLPRFLPSAPPIIFYVAQDARPWEISFPPIMRLSGGPPGFPSHQNVFGRMPSRGNPFSSHHAALRTFPGLSPPIKYPRGDVQPWESLLFPPCGSPGVPQASPPIKMPSGGCPAVGIPFPPITRLSGRSPGFPDHQNILVGMFGRGNFPSRSSAAPVLPPIKMPPGGCRP